MLFSKSRAIFWSLPIFLSTSEDISPSIIPNRCFSYYLEMRTRDTFSNLFEERLLDLDELGGLDHVQNLLDLAQKHHLKIISCTHVRHINIFGPYLPLLWEILVKKWNSNLLYFQRLLIRHFSPLMGPPIGVWGSRFGIPKKLEYISRSTQHAHFIPLSKKNILTINSYWNRLSIKFVPYYIRTLD